ncbi:MlaD family protein [Croceiramulus getboli]|nr:MlaD family protein [Flavobacteriaceae bacterium YJPT1-3]
MEKKSFRIRLGVFVVIGTLVLISALYFIGNRQHLFTQNITVHALFTNLNGLQLGNTVRFSGIDVGTVSDIVMQSDTLILVEMRIKESTREHLRKNAIATIASDGLVGNMLISILPADHSGPFISHQDTLATYSKIRTDDMLTTLNATNENAALLTADLLEITTAIKNAEGTLGMLIHDPTVANNLKQMVSNLNGATQEAKKVIREVQEFTSQMNQESGLLYTLTGDTLASRQFKATLANLEKSSHTIVQSTSIIDTLLRDMKTGRGALHYLTQDTVLVSRIRTTVDEVTSSSQKLNENLEAMRHNFLFRRYFKKQERAQKKDN